MVIELVLSQGEIGGLGPCKGWETPAAVQVGEKISERIPFLFGFASRMPASSFISGFLSFCLVRSLRRGYACSICTTIILVNISQFKRMLLLYLSILLIYSFL